MKTLKEIFDAHECDKGSKRHRYDRVYEPIFERVRDEEINLLEVGVLRGESLKSHHEYFPKANLYSIDIFGRVPAEKVDALKYDRVKWCNCDSLVGPNDDFKNMVGDKKFDIIIDDGLHFHDSQRLTFENFVPYLKDDGVYFIEDVWAFNVMNEKQKNHNWMKKYAREYSDKQYNHLLKVLEPYNVAFHDLRDGYQLDTYIIEIRK